MMWANMVLRGVFSIAICVSLLTSVRSQQIVDRSVIKDGETFTLTCDAGRAGAPPTFQNIAIVKLSRKLTSPPQTQYTQLAQYRFLGKAGETQDAPDLSWQFSFTDAGDGTISVLVSQAKCSDAGLYKCEVDYISKILSNTLQTEMREQDVTSEAGINNLVFTWDPNTSDFVNPYYQQHMEDENITITCRVDGPQYLRLQWMRGIKQAFSQSDDRVFIDYPHANDITTTATSLGSNTCGAYRHTSILRLKLQAVDDATMYKCAIMENGQEVMSAGNLTIGIIGPGVGPGGSYVPNRPGGPIVKPVRDDGEQEDNEQAATVAAGVLAGVVVICFGVITFLLIRIRGLRRRKSGNANVHALDEIRSPVYEGGTNYNYIQVIPEPLTSEDATTSDQVAALNPRDHQGVGLSYKATSPYENTI